MSIPRTIRATPYVPKKSFRSAVRFPRSGSRFLDAAKQDDLTAGWTSTNYSGDAILRGQLDIVRARSRDLCSNEPYFRRFLGLCEENVIGPDGISLQMRVIEKDTKEGVVMDESANRMIEAAWYKWTKKRNCTLNQRDSLIALEQIALRTVARDGEIFIRKIRGAKNDFRFALQMIEADHVDTRHNEEFTNGNYIRMGIEYDANDIVIAYHILKRHPGDYAYQSGINQQRIRIPASDMVHLFVRERPSQSRGIPWGASSMTRSKMLSGYEQAELVAARAGASKMGFFTSPDGQGYTGDGEGLDSDGNKVTITEADPGTFEQLPAGVDFKAFDVDHPSSAFESFTKRILRGITTGFGVGYNALTNDYEGVNYSSLRQSHLTERDYWRKLQSWMIENLLGEIFSDWLLMSITSGQLQLPILKLDKFDAATWRPRGWTWVDPVKEITANKMAIELGLDSATNIIAQQGRDIEDIYQDMKNEASLRKKYGLELTPSSTTVIFSGDATNAASQ